MNDCQSKITSNRYVTKKAPESVYENNFVFKKDSTSLGTSRSLAGLKSMRVFKNDSSIQMIESSDKSVIIKSNDCVKKPSLIHPLSQSKKGMNAILIRNLLNDSRSRIFKQLPESHETENMPLIT